MKTIIRGIAYDTGRDADLRHDDTIILPSDTYETLRQTPEGNFYVHTQIPQMYKDGEWRPPYNHKEWWDYVDDVSKEPWDKARQLETIRPVTREEALDWCIENLLPKCVRAAEKP